MRYEPGAVLGMPAAGLDQLFLVVAGSGWVRVADGDRVPVAAGRGVVWRDGEQHESGSEEGMEAVIVQAEELTVGP